MACSACKNAARVAAVNGDGTNIMESRNWLMKCVSFIVQLFFGIFAGAVILILIIPLLIYVTVCLMLGKEPHVVLKNPLGNKSVTNNKEFIEDARQRMEKRNAVK